ncbi:hypothetical protein [Sorangium sp. So ce1335]|uniref:hypothetical protein n=1 Tax=Sorangium sp. So ce1335 TaxID=3133335 RepID=UPI003F5F4A72
MSEPAQLAKSARELLAAALNALQSNGSVSPQVEALAEPIAKAMGIMHRIERSGGQALDGSDVALGHVRDVLNRLQSITVPDPVVDVLMEHVASSLSKVHALSRAQAAAAQAPAPVAVAAPPPVAVAPAPVAAAPAPVAAPPPVAVAAPPPVAVAAPPPIVAPAPVAVVAPAPVAAVPAPVPAAAPAHLQQTLPSPQQPRHAPAPPAPPAADARRAPPFQATVPSADHRAPPFQATVPSADHRAPAAVVDVELGALTPSNFYKGLAGNDIIEHGGIFVATYKIPPIGTPVTLRVRLPGNYEFTASATVRWTREASGSRDSVEPGFGARITQISAEGRQLVSRFTRNREPLFYDDL